MITKWNVMLARFPGGASEHPHCVDWIIKTHLQLKDDPRVGAIEAWWENDTPVTMSRNKCIRDAVHKGMDIVIMVDSDMGPDAFMANNNAEFWPRAFEFMTSRWDECPTMVAAPYCGRPPQENVYIFRWRNRATDDANMNIYLDQFTREEAAERHGFEAVAGLPTGVIAIDLRLFTGFKGAALPPPWFYYEYTDIYQSKKASTEDVTFSRNAAVMFREFGDVCWVDWESWAVHYKLKSVLPPVLVDPGYLGEVLAQVEKFKRNGEYFAQSI